MNFSATRGIPFILWKPYVHYRVHKSPPPVSISTPTLLYMFPNYFTLHPQAPHQKKTRILILSFQDYKLKMLWKKSSFGLCKDDGRSTKGEFFF
jgi:hypothetical protein